MKKNRGLANGVAAGGNYRRRVLDVRAVRSQPRPFPTVVLALMLVFVCACHSENSPNRRYEVMFQELLFNIPEGPVVRATLDLGKRTLTPAQTDAEVLRNEFAWDDGTFRLTYLVSGAGSSWTLETGGSVVAEGSFLSDVALCANGPFWVADGSLNSTDWSDAYKASHRIDAIACSEDGLVVFANGEVSKLVDGKELRTILRPGGLITNAGQLDGPLVWFWRRLNEKAAGTLWILDVSSNETIKIKSSSGQAELIGQGKALGTSPAS